MRICAKQNLVAKATATGAGITLRRSESETEKIFRLFFQYEYDKIEQKNRTKHNNFLTMRVCI